VVQAACLVGDPARRGLNGGIGTGKAISRKSSDTPRSRSTRDSFAGGESGKHYLRMSHNLYYVNFYSRNRTPPFHATSYPQYLRLLRSGRHHGFTRIRDASGRQIALASIAT
jgi:hypothetical protein